MLLSCFFPILYYLILGFFADSTSESTNYRNKQKNRKPVGMHIKCFWVFTFNKNKKSYNNTLLMTLSSLGSFTTLFCPSTMTKCHNDSTNDGFPCPETVMTVKRTNPKANIAYLVMAPVRRKQKVLISDNSIKYFYSPGRGIY